MMAGTAGLNFVQDHWQDYWMDVCQSAKKAPNVLSFPFELGGDGSTLPRPVNYSLGAHRAARGHRHRSPPKPPLRRRRSARRPRSGHRRHEARQRDRRGAGRGPRLLFHRLPAPPGAWPDDRGRMRCRSRLRRAGRGPAPGGRGQAGDRRQLPGRLAAHDDGRDPAELCGPILLAGSPLSYWAGVQGRNPMRYLGGKLGGTWLTALAGDLGNGIFDGANLVVNFESLNPANTWWEKPYNLYAKVDTEVPRFLGFETWWGNPVLLNAGEMQWIADNLFVGNKLTSGEIHTSAGVRVDLRNIRLADRRAVLVGRQHHAAAAGAGLDHRPLRARGRDRRQRPDHRLHAASVDRPSRHLRFRQGRHPRARRVRHLHGDDRPAAARPLRGR